MNFKAYFLYQSDYQHWAFDALFNALDRLDNAALTAPDRVFFGSICTHAAQLVHFYRKWLAHLGGNTFENHAQKPETAEWNIIKNQLRHELRCLHHFLEQQPEAYFDAPLQYRHTLHHDETEVWVKDALSHLFIHSATERGRMADAAIGMGAPNPELSYLAYRGEMREHMRHLSLTVQGGDA